MTTVHMAFEGILGWTRFITVRTGVALIGPHVLGFNVVGNGSVIFCIECAVIASPAPVNFFEHHGFHGQLSF